MEYVGINPKDAIFIIILSPCSHVGLVKEGYQYFKLGLIIIVLHHNECTIHAS